jgi:hypothetical protein
MDRGPRVEEFHVVFFSFCLSLVVLIAHCGFSYVFWILAGVSRWMNMSNAKRI